MFGKVEDNNDSYYTSEQLALLMAVDPDFKDKYEKEEDLKNQIDYEKLKEKSDSFDQRMPLDGSTANMLDLDFGESEKSGEGIRAPNAYGSGVSAPNGGAIYNTVMEYIKKHNPQFNKFSNDLMRMKSKQAWRNILKYGKNMTRDILKDYVDNDFDRNQLNKKIKRSFNKMIPYKFKRLLKSNMGDPGSFIEKERRLNNFSLAKPVIKYGINEIAGSGPISKKAYKEALKHVMNNYGYYGNGKLNWKKVGKIAKKGLSKALKYLKNFGDKFISGDNLKNKITDILNNFEVLRDLGLNDEFGDIGQHLIKKGYNKGYDKIQDKLDDDYSDVEEDIQKIKKGYSKAKNIINNAIDEHKKNSVFDNMEDGDTTTLENGNVVGKHGFGKVSKNSKGPAVRFVIK